MPVVRHGRMDLSWCRKCVSPLISRGKCPTCDSLTIKVGHTPPGDIRPAFPFDIDQISKLADGQWGKGTGEALGLRKGPVLLNPCPAPDRLDEIISNGHVLGSISFSSRYLRDTLILRRGGGEEMRSSGFRPERGYVVCDPTAVPFILDGKNLLSPGIIGAADGIEPGDELLILDENGLIIGSGLSKKSSDDMVGTKGMGVKVRWTISPDENIDISRNGPKRSWEEIWDHVVEVNTKYIRSKVKGSIRFIRQTMEDFDLPAVVSYSGGKDSLATLLLTKDAGLDLPIMFIDTGIEFPETVDHVHDLVDRMGLKLYEGNPAVPFFENLEKFGPPGRDYRWCCKSCKLGPTTSLIGKNFEDGVLSFIGQRRFESDTRERKGSVWRNPWVPQQRGASPVQNWTALDVWVYIFKKKAPYNPLYARGFQRIGCWLCPSCDLAETSLVSNTEVDTEPFESFLRRTRDEGGYPEEWLKHGFHRFKSPPPHMRVLAQELGIEKDLAESPGIRRKGSDLLEMVDGYGSCVDGLSKEGILGKDIIWDRTIDILKIIGTVMMIEGTDGYSVRPQNWRMKRPAIEIYRDGTMVIRGGDEEEIRDLERRFVSVLKRAAGCVGCQICIGRCEKRAIELDDQGRITIDDSRCVHCGMCLGPCPAESFGSDPYNE